jgi:hypothetical protein
MEQRKMTAVEWLEQEFIKLESTIGVYGIMYELIEKAKEMEKEQIEDAFEIGYDNGACVQEGNAIYHGSNYYNKIFKSE